MEASRAFSILIIQQHFDLFDIFQAFDRGIVDPIGFLRFEFFAFQIETQFLPAIGSLHRLLGAFEIHPLSGLESDSDADGPFGLIARSTSNPKTSKL